MEVKAESFQKWAVELEENVSKRKDRKNSVWVVPALFFPVQ